MDALEGPFALMHHAGSASDILIHAEDMLKTKQRLTRLYTNHCRRPYEEVERTLDRDHFTDAESARDRGLIDRVIVYGTKREFRPHPLPAPPPSAGRRSGPSGRPRC